MELRQPSANDATQSTSEKKVLKLSPSIQHITQTRAAETSESVQSIDSDDPPRCTVQCKVCGKWFLDNYFLHRHELVHTKEKPHQCEKCSKSFTQKTSLGIHMLIHLREKKFQCSLCPMKFIQKNNLTTHVKLRHPALDDPVLPNGFLCQKCPSVFKCAGRLRVHRARIHGEMVMFDQWLKPTTATTNSKQQSSSGDYEDDNNTTSSHEDSSASNTTQQMENDGEIVHKIIKSRRTEHMKGITKGRPHVCEVCKAAFKKPQYLTQHMISHTGIRPHRCNVCNKTFSSKQSYSTHMKLHSNTVRLFNCAKCDESFNRHATLKRHQTMIHSALQYVYRCPFCDIQFRWVHNARSHIKTFHLKKSTEEIILEPIKESVENKQWQPA
ncbi:zinc finger protein 501-like [Anopheles marshallii]|uniref:zinc finger protein 501-like n=1 Tax=Anopheles marshallii TaxID=1521116 RepID=UPI00237B1B35|nr:zinc finger protein 501-like [Anopheles marshallii]